MTACKRATCSATSRAPAGRASMAGLALYQPSLRLLIEHCLSQTKLASCCFALVLEMSACKRAACLGDHGLRPVVRAWLAWLFSQAIIGS